MERALVVKVTVGQESAERCMQAFNVASAALAGGASVSLWLAAEASWFAVPGRAEQFELEHSPPLARLLALCLEQGTVTLCTQCAARRGLAEADLIPGIRIAGAATFAAEALEPRAQALVY